MRRKTRAKVGKVLKIVGIILGIIALIMGIIIIIKINKTPSSSYDDILVGKNYFEQITINLNTNKIKRDGTTTTLVQEFGISKEEEDLALSSKEELNNLLSKSVFEVSSSEEGIYSLKNPFQTKKLIVQADNIEEVVKGEDIVELQNGLYILSFYSEKLTKAMYEYYQNKDYIKNIFYDEVFIDKPVGDESQTMYGGTDVELNGYHSLGVSVLGLDNYHKIIEENGNPNEIIISSIGYGINASNEFFNGRTYSEGYNFILDNKNTLETISQGSRIAEVLVDSTTNNVKIMPLVVVTEEGYSSISSIMRAIVYATKNTDVICYELITKQNDAIDLVLENAFKENIPVCTISTSKYQENYPANHAMTIATSSLNRENLVADYSGRGDFIDFALPSTDVEEIFGSNLSVSRWSGVQYSNAQIASEIALIKTYNKDATILEVYNFLRNFCIDLGESGKDELYGYGMPQFSNLTISDIDKQPPTFTELIYENETWELLKQVKIKATDNIRITGWAITRNEEGPQEEEWRYLESVTPDLDVTTEITENGTYYIWVQDSAGNIVNKSMVIDKVDNTPPQIAYTINKDNLQSGYATIVVTAEDNGSGLYDSPFSWDKITWSSENSTKTITENGRYKVYAVDNLGNISELEILVNVFPQEGTANIGEGDIIDTIYVSAEWNNNINNNVQIKLKPNQNLIGWQLTETIERPNEFETVGIEQTITITTDNNNSNTNSSTTNTQNETTSNETSNNWTNTSQNTTNTTTTRTQTIIKGNNDQIQITKALSTGTTYYIWTKDENENIRYQTFTIDKPII